MEPKVIQLQNLGMQAMNGQSIDMLGMVQQQFGNLSLGSGINLSNVLAGIDSLDQMGSSNPQQKASAMQSLLNNVMGIISKLGTGEASAASSEVSKNNKDAQQTASDAEQKAADLKTNFEAIQGKIEEENQAIQKSNEEAEKLQEKQKAEEDKIKRSVDNINGLKNSLYGAADPEQQRTLLDAITLELGNIGKSIEAVTSIKAELSACSSQVEEAYTNLTNYSAEATETSETGAQNIEQLTAKAQQNISDNTKTEAQVPVNETTSAEAAAAAKAASSNPITGVSAAPQLYRVSADQKSAASVRAIGSATVWAQITQSIGSMTNGAELLTSYSDTIGSALGNCENLVGSWNTLVSPMITSIGSVEQLQQTITGEFLPAVEADDKTIEAALDTKNNAASSNASGQDNNPAGQNDRYTKAMAAAYIQQITIGSQQTAMNQPQGKQANNLQTPQKELKVQFGV